MSVPPFLDSIIKWLRAGYPEGVPANDYVPLLALLTRRLSDDEVLTVAEAIRSRDEAPVDKADIQIIITKITNEMPLEDDVARVRSRLAASGWPLADPFTLEPPHGATPPS